MLRRSFKNAAFSEKIVENHFWEDMAVLRGRVRLVTKISIILFVGNEVLNIFHQTIFSKKQYFSK